MSAWFSKECSLFFGIIEDFHDILILYFFDIPEMVNLAIHFDNIEPNLTEFFVFEFCLSESVIYCQTCIILFLHLVQMIVQVLDLLLMNL